MTTKREICAKADQALKGNWLKSIFVLLLMIVATVILSCTGVGALLIPLTVIAYSAYNLELVNTKKANVKLVFASLFKNGIKKWCLIVLTSLFVGLWSLLLVIPGIVMSFAYAMAPYILLDNPDMGVMEALRESKKMMKGYKGKLFWQELSFAILAFFTGLISFGLIPLLGVAPHRAASRAQFYVELKDYLAQQTAPAEEAVQAE